MTNHYYLEDPLPGKPFPKEGELYRVVRDRNVNLYYLDSESIMRMIHLPSGIVFMMLQAYHVEVEEEDFIDEDDEVYSYYVLRFDCLHNEKVYKDVEISFNEWKAYMERVEL